MTHEERIASILLDDGAFYVCLKPGYEDAWSAPGLLHKRCAIGERTPFGYDCVGAFRRAGDGQWVAVVNAEANDPIGRQDLIVASGMERMSAICALWKARHRAWARYADDADASQGSRQGPDGPSWKA